MGLAPVAWLLRLSNCSRALARHIPHHRGHRRHSMGMVSGSSSVESLVSPPCARSRRSRSDARYSLTCRALSFPSTYRRLVSPVLPALCRWLLPFPPPWVSASASFLSQVFSHLLGPLVDLPRHGLRAQLPPHATVVPESRGREARGRRQGQREDVGR